MNKWLKQTDKFWTPIYIKHNKIEPQSLWGSVLYVGMGSSLIPRLQSDKVTKTTIVEIDKDVIDFNFENNLIKDDWVIVYMDGYDYIPTETFDFIFVDIWYNSIPTQVVDELVNKYRKYLNDGGTIFSLTTIKK